MKKVIFVTFILVMTAILFLSCDYDMKDYLQRSPEITRLDVSKNPCFFDEILNLSADAVDPDKDPVSFYWITTGGTLLSTSGKEVKWRAPQTSGDIEILVVVTDETSGKNVTKSLIVTVSSSPAANSLESNIVVTDEGAIEIGGEVDPAITVRANGQVDVNAPANFSHSARLEGFPLLYGFTNPTGIPTGDGYRVLQQDDFFESGNEALVFEKTGSSDVNPDGGFAFVATGNDGVAEPALVIDGNRNVGIGVLNPKAPLHLNGYLQWERAGWGTFLNIGTNESGIPSGDGFRFRFLTGQENIWGSNDAIVFEKTDANATSPDGAVIFANTGSNNTPVATLTIKGNNCVGIRNTAPSYPLDVAGIIRGSNVSVSSDLRWKKNISPLTWSLEKVLNLRGVSYNWRTEEFPGKNFDDSRQIGFIAQEVEPFLPELVLTDSEGYKSVNYPAMSAVLVEAVKELKQEQDDRISTLEAEILLLKEENQALSEKLTRVESLMEELLNR